MTTRTLATITADVAGAPNTIRAGELTARVIGADHAVVVAPTAPFTGRPVAALQQASEDDVRQALRTTRSAQAKWPARPANNRQRVLLRLLDLILDREDEVLDLLHRVRNNPVALRCDPRACWPDLA